MIFHSSRTNDCSIFHVVTICLSLKYPPIIYHFSFSAGVMCTHALLRISYISCYLWINNQHHLRNWSRFEGKKERIFCLEKCLYIPDVSQNVLHNSSLLSVISFPTSTHHTESRALNQWILIQLWFMDILNYVSFPSKCSWRCWGRKIACKYLSNFDFRSLTRQWTEHQLHILIFNWLPQFLGY